MKKIVVFFLIFTNLISAQFTDDFERYNYQQRISSQSLNWITWSEDPNTGAGYILDEDGIVSNTDFPNFGQSQHFASSGKQALFIGGNNLGSQPQDVVLDLHNKSKGTWNLSWKAYIPKRKTAYYNFQENTPIIGVGNWAIQVKFKKNKRGTIQDDNGGNIVNFKYPQDEWFVIKHTIDLDNDHILIELITNSGSEEIYNANFLSNTQHLGGVDFYSNAKNNRLYIDDILFEKFLPIKDSYVWKNNRWEDLNGNPISGQPDNSYEVVLKEPFTVGASTSASNLNCLNLVFEETGSLKIPSKTNVVISGNLIIPINNFIRVDDGGSFVMLNNTAIIDMPNPNSFQYTRTSNALLDAYDYTYWSSPVKNIAVSSFGSSAVYTYNTANYIDLYSGVGYPQTTGSPDRHDDNGDDWIFANSTDNIIAGKGYAVLSPGNTTNHTITFSGEPNNGFISVPVSLSGDNTNNDDDWNLIGNPYPSAIQSDVLINSNINLSGTLYFWTHNTQLGGGSNTGPSNSNYNINDYASYNLSGGVAASTGGEIPNGFIAAGQGFFMEVIDNGTITFNNDMRVVNTVDENTQFYKTPKYKSANHSDLAKENKIWLNFSNQNGAFSQSLIAFLPGATDDFEANYDGIKAGSNLNTKFYSILKGRELAIQGRSILNDDTQIPLGFYIKKPEEFTISIKRLEGDIATTNYDVYLIDNLLNKTHNLKQADYHFDISEPGTNNSRFTLQIISTTLKVTTFSNLKNDVIIANYGNILKISAVQKVKSIKVYDILGRALINNKPDKKSFNLLMNNVKKGTVLVVQAQLENGALVSKKVILF